jgi:hypothetical protein
LLHDRAQALDLAPIVGLSAAHSGLARGQGDEVESREVERGERIEHQARPVAQHEEGAHGVAGSQTEVSAHVQHRVGMRSVQGSLEALGGECAVGEALAGQRPSARGGSAAGR